MARAPLAKKLNLFRAYATGRPVWCAWQVNYRCNFHCAFCHYWIDPQGDAPELTVEQFRAGSEKLSRLGSLLVSLAGGEPLIRPDIVAIVRAVGEYHFPFLTTNAWFVTPSLADELFAAGLWGVSVSIDYADEQQHDRRRGMPGAHARALESLKLFNAARRHSWQRVNWMSVLLDDNLDQLETMIQMAAERGAYFMVQPYGHRKTGSRKFQHDGPVSAHLLALRKKYPNFLSNPYFLSRFDAAVGDGVPGCLAGKGFFNIDSGGAISVCVEEKGRPVANLFTDSPGAIVRQLQADPTPRDCSACWYNCRGEIEALYHPAGLMMSLPTLLFDRGRAPVVRAGGS